MVVVLVLVLIVVVVVPVVLVPVVLVPVELVFLALVTVVVVAVLVVRVVDVALVMIGWFGTKLHRVFTVSTGSSRATASTTAAAPRAPPTSPQVARWCGPAPIVITSDSTALFSAAAPPVVNWTAMRSTCANWGRASSE